MGRPPTIENPRQRILDQAGKLFAENGYETSSLSALAMAMGMSKAAVYHYFQTKEQIYDAIILDTLSGLTDAVRQAVSQGSGARDRLKQFMSAHARYFEAHRNGFVVMLAGFSGMANSEFRAEAMALRDAHERQLRGIIEEGIASGEFRGVDPVTTGRAVLSLLSWMARWFKPDGGATAEELVTDYFNLLLGGLEGAEAAGR